MFPLRPFRWFWIALGAMFLLIGIAALISTVYTVNTGTALTTGPRHFPFFFVFPFFGWGFLFLVLLLFFGLRWIFWPWRRRYYSGWYSDPALDILRQRYARGEITKEQFDQMARDLEAQHRNH